MIAPKPLVKPTAPNARLPERKAVTIIAGFKCLEGIVVCADTQETVFNLSKRNVPKIKVEPPSAEIRKILGGSDLVAAFCGSGVGPFIDMVTSKAWQAAESAESLDDACERVETRIKAIYEEYGRIYQVGHCPSVELIYGVKMDGASRLFKADGPVVNEIEESCSAGAGYYMADFLTSRMYGGYIPLPQCVILAAYVLSQAKEHVDGCGGESHIAVLRNEGRSGMIDQGRIRAITRLLSSIDRQFSELLIAAADLADPYDKEKISTALSLIESFRDFAKEDINKSDSFSDFLSLGNDERDDLGFVKPSVSEKLEDLL